MRARETVAVSAVRGVGRWGIGCGYGGGSGAGAGVVWLDLACLSELLEGVEEFFEEVGGYGGAVFGGAADVVDRAGFG